MFGEQTQASIPWYPLASPSWPRTQQHGDQFISAFSCSQVKIHFNGGSGCVGEYFEMGPARVSSVNSRISTVRDVRSDKSCDSRYKYVLVGLGLSLRLGAVSMEL